MSHSGIGSVDAMDRCRKKLSIVCNNGIDLNPGQSHEHLAFDAIAARNGYINGILGSSSQAERHMTTA
jgi:hypothetical protein